MSEQIQKQFQVELDAAIASLSVKIVDMWSERVVPQPVITVGITRQEATLRTVDSLVLRTMTMGAFENQLLVLMRNARDLLVTKNASYGNSALDPVRIWSEASTREQLLVRLDDKMSRLSRGQAAGEDVAKDTLGYLLLLEILENRETPVKTPQKEP